jgi:hypothetical protein
MISGEVCATRLLEKKEMRKEETRRYRLKKKAEGGETYYSKNKAVLVERQRQYRIKNKEAEKKRASDYYLKN